jgi:hypothetical protein
MFFAVSCVSADKNIISKKKAEEISFSIAQSKTPTGGLILIGSSSTCSVKWELSKGILTHRMNCPKVSEDELWAYLLGMSSKLKAVNTKPFYFVRFTTKDFPKEENYVGRLVAGSKMWGKLNSKNIKNKKHKNFSNKFLTKVIEKKKVFSLVPKALNTMGYNFKVSETKIERFARSSKGTLIPKSAKVVFKAERPSKVK